MKQAMFARAGGPEVEGVESGQGIPIPFTAATPGVKSDGLDIGDLPWDFGRGDKQVGERVRFPMLVGHDMSRSTIGAVDVWMDGKVMRGLAYFDPEDEDAVKLERKYRSPIGGMRGFSISWDFLDDAGMSVRVSGGKPAIQELLEVSAVAVPLDKDAVAGERAALRALRSEIDSMIEALDGDEAAGDETGDEDTDAIDLDTIADAVAAKVAALLGMDEPTTADDEPSLSEDSDSVDEETPADDGEDGVARAVAAMVNALDPDADLGDRERRKRYNRACAMYRRVGLEAPELVKGAELRALSAHDWVELFVEGELPVARAGAVLNRTNRERLQRAKTNIDEVLMSAGVDNRPEENADDERGIGGSGLDSTLAEVLARLGG